MRCFALVLVCGLALSASGCGTDPAEGLVLLVESEAPAAGALESLEVLVTDGEARRPEPAGRESARLPLGEGLDPTVAPVVVAIEGGLQTFPGRVVSVQVSARVDAVVATRWEGTLTLGERAEVPVRLTRVDGACDADFDGFPDCGIPGCCAEGSAFDDCGPRAATVNPWVVEDPCEPCADEVDQDCSGADAACVDEDADGVQDCEEVAAACGVGDADVAPDLKERCDGIDNDCDGGTDEDFQWQGLPIGAACGSGACAGGVVACEAAGQARCSTLDSALEEACGDGVDNDCDGKVDEGCGDDLDGDGFTSTAVTLDLLDCDDFDAGVFPGAPEGCCPVGASCTDANCDGKTTPCAADDADGDGFGGANDCDDTDPSVNPAAPEKCGDGIDQDCFAGDVPCATVTDGDGDGWSPPADCDDDEAGVGPGAAELCNGVDDDCDGLTDEGNPEGGQACGTDQGACTYGVAVCAVGAGVQCTGETGGDEICDGVDNDCDGETDEDFIWGGAPVGGACDGIGACGPGVVECLGEGAATCRTNPDGSASGAKPEACNGLDDDCDGETDEEVSPTPSACLFVGVCAGGDSVIALCVDGGWACDYAGVEGYEPGQELSCDGLDNDCDGFVDEDFAIGKGCDGDDEDDCANGTWACAADGVSAQCVEGGAVVEVCDGLDNDCDGETDEDFPQLGEPCDGADADACVNGTFECAPNGQGVACLNEAPANLVELCNGADDDCDGETDEDFPELGGPCDSDDADFCENGTWTCTAGGAAVECANEAPSGLVESCNGQDDDCDGLTDEQLTPDIACPDLGVCEAGVPAICQGEQGWSCDTTLVAGYQEGDEAGRCDGLDNDCDGAVDEDFPTLGQPCGQGVCAGGVVVCGADPAQTACSTDGDQGVEVCGGGDEDCDGEVDEGCCGDLPVPCPLGFGCAAEGYCVSDADPPMVYVPAGDFEMGCTDSPAACASSLWADANPAHVVTLSAFAIDQTEVTVAMYSECEVHDGCDAIKVKGGGGCPKGDASKAEGQALNFVTWTEAQAYCTWRGARLCTEAEWEKAARGDDGRKWPWGDTPADCGLAVMDEGSGKGCGSGEVSVVGTLPAGRSPYGALDMAGNLAEWVADRYADDWYVDSPAVDPVGPDSGGKRVIRGGAYTDDAEGVVVWRRDADNPGDECSDRGFRCCVGAP